MRGDMFRTPLYLLVAALMCSKALAEPSITAFLEISIVPHDGMFTVSGKVIGLQPSIVTATLTVDRSDAGGRMKTNQSRKIEVSTGSTDMVAETTFSVQEGMILNITMSLYDGDVSIGSATTSFGAKAE
jgi:hypothetical protein